VQSRGKLSSLDGCEFFEGYDGYWIKYKGVVCGRSFVITQKLLNPFEIKNL
jgi:hypothetical protein